MGKKQYNYEKKRHYDKDNKYTTCVEEYNKCDGSNEEISSTSLSGATCKKLFLNFVPDGVENKYVFDRWVSTIIFSCLIAACCIGLAIFGFLLFKSDGSGL